MAAIFKKLNVISLLANLFMASLLTISCVATKTASIDPKQPIDTAANTAKAVGVGVIGAATDIDAQALIIKTATPPAVLPKIQQNFTNIQTDTNDLRTLKGQLDTVQVNLDQANQAVGQLKTDNGALKTQVTDLQAAQKNALHNMFMWLSVLSVVGIGVAAALVYTGNALGITVGVASVVTLGASIVVGQYTAWFAIGVGVLMLAGIGVCIYDLWKKKTIATQLVQTVEANKLAMRTPARHYLFGNSAVPGHIDIIQSAMTKAFVSKIRDSGKIRLAPSTPAVEIGTNE